MQDVKVRKVWASNLSEEIEAISTLIERYNYISLDVEFPGVILRPIGDRAEDKAQHVYNVIAANVDILKPLQIGITIHDSEGSKPPSFGCCWQFNFHFDTSQDIFAQDAVDTMRKDGVDLEKHEKEGIDTFDFAELIMTSGLVLNPDVVWVSYYSAWDFIFMLKLLTNLRLPSSEPAFYELLQIFFPCTYDIKLLMEKDETLAGKGLFGTAEKYNIAKKGATHQAGPNSLLAMQVFFAIRKQVFYSSNPEGLKGILLGLNADIRKQIPFEISNGFF